MASTKTKLPSNNHSEVEGKSASERAIEEALAKPAEPVKAATPVQPTAEVDLAAATIHGQDAYAAIMEAAEAEAQHLCDTGAAAIKMADNFKKQFVDSVINLTQPLVVAAMEFDTLCRATADEVLAEAKAKSAEALMFTSRLRDMNQALTKSANGEGNERPEKASGGS